MNKSHTVTHYRKKCIGCGSCVMLAPQTWSISEQDGLAMLEGSRQKGEVYVGAILETDLEDNLLAQESCPVRIIKVL